MKAFRTSILICICSFLFGCSSKPMYRVVYYKPAYRQSPPEETYSRLMWSHLPEPVRPKARDDAPLLLPEVFVELKDVTLDEAVEAVAQTMGYRWEYPEVTSKNRITIHMEANVEDVLEEIRRQSLIPLAFDHEKRMIRLQDRTTQLKLPSRPDGNGRSIRN
jgi:hypothetical protein